MERAGFDRKPSFRKTQAAVLYVVFLGCVLVGIAGLVTLLAQVLAEGVPWLSWRLLTDYPSRHPEQAGLRAAIFGTVWIMGLTAAFTVPIGVGAAVYLEEYAPRNWLTSVLEVNISNLAGVPSVVYGLLGLALFVQIMALGKTVIAGALTLTLLVLPIVILASREAIRAVPDTYREAAYGLGADKWQVVKGVVLPCAFPGILTGTILAMSRAIGEAAPIVVISGARLPDLRAGQPHGPLHGAAPPDIQLGVPPPGRLPQPGRRGDHRAAGRTALDERGVHRAAQPLSDQVGGVALAQNGYVLRAESVGVWYGEFQALREIDLNVSPQSVTALIGPSGCGKSTLLRCFNRMNDLVQGARVEGRVLFNGSDINAPEVDATEIRSHVGMVFQKPNPFPKSIYDNVAFGLRVNGYRGDYDEAVERSLRRAALWDEVKDRLNSGALTLSGGQQQRLCIARALAVEPEVLLMDEPGVGLGPDSDAGHRAAYPGAGQGDHHRHRDPQHAAGRPRLRRDRLPDGGGGQDRLPSGARPHEPHLHRPPERADRSLHHRTIQLGASHASTRRPQGRFPPQPAPA